MQPFFQQSIGQNMDMRMTLSSDSAELWFLLKIHQFQAKVIDTSESVVSDQTKVIDTSEAIVSDQTKDASVPEQTEVRKTNETIVAELAKSSEQLMLDQIIPEPLFKDQSKEVTNDKQSPKKSTPSVKYNCLAMSSSIFLYGTWA